VVFQKQQNQFFEFAYNNVCDLLLVLQVMLIIFENFNSCLTRSCVLSFFRYIIHVLCMNFIAVSNSTCHACETFTVQFNPEINLGTRHSHLKLESKVPKFKV
jgi:hypothetical protein